MASNYTENYQLCQWEATDQVQRTEFNADHAKIDTALSNKAEAAALEALSSTVSGLSDTVAEHTASLASMGNCQIYYMTYVGNGTYGAGKQTVITFPKRPLLVVVADGSGASVLAIRGMSTGYRREHGTSYVNLGWGVNNLILSQPDGAEEQMNQSGVTYHVVALLAEDN